MKTKAKTIDLSTVDVFSLNGYTYTGRNYEVKGNIFEITIVSGKKNAVIVNKLTNNPFRGLGKEFESFEAANEHYKSAEMKTALLMAEMGLCQTV